MTREEAQKASERWKQSGNLPCDHVLDLEIDGAYMTGAYACILCGCHVSTSPSLHDVSVSRKTAS
jgi:hypothetical protein